MKNTRLIALLKSFEKPELNRLSRYILSAGNGVYPDTQCLFRVLVPHYPVFDENAILKEKIFREAFGPENFDQQLLSNNMKYLCEAIEHFIVFEKVKNRPYIRQKLLVEQMRERGDKLYGEGLDKLESIIKQEKEIHVSEKLFSEFSLYEERDVFFARSGMRSQDDFIQKKNDALDRWFLYQKLKTWCEMLNRQNIVSSVYRFSVQKEIQHFLSGKEGRDLLRLPEIKTYHTVYLSLTEPEHVKHYTDLLDLLKKHRHSFSNEELRNLYDFAQNYCIKKLNSGDIEFGKKLFDLYASLLEEKILMNEEGYLSVWDYKNIVALSVRLKKNTWCKQFIEKYQHFIQKKERDNAYTYNLAYYFSSIENYKEAKRLLQRVDLNDPFYLLGSKSVLLRCYYELEDEEAFFAHCESFKKLLLRNKTISAYQRKVHLNLILYARKAFRLLLRRTENKRNVSRKEIENLKEKMVLLKQINNLPWLLEKVEEMM